MSQSPAGGGHGVIVGLPHFRHCLCECAWAKLVTWLSIVVQRVISPDRNNPYAKGTYDSGEEDQYIRRHVTDVPVSPMVTDQR